MSRGRDLLGHIWQHYWQHYVHNALGVRQSYVGLDFGRIGVIPFLCASVALQTSVRMLLFRNGIAPNLRINKAGPAQ
jgi:hypothetical protein